MGQASWRERTENFRRVQFYKLNPGFRNALRTIGVQVTNLNPNGVKIKKVSK